MGTALLNVADALLDAEGDNSVLARRAVSAAYYAVFHAVARTCASLVLSDAFPHSDEYVRIYRALDHGTLKIAFRQPALAGDEDLRKFGEAVVLLQSERIQADYMPLDIAVFKEEDARRLIAMARQALTSLDKLTDAQRRKLAVNLLFKTR